jgi:hypothetical protein
MMDFFVCLLLLLFFFLKILFFCILFYFLGFGVIAKSEQTKVWNIGSECGLILALFILYLFLITSLFYRVFSIRIEWF